MENLITSRPNVMRSVIDILTRIENLEQEKANLLIDYAKSEQDSEQTIIAQMIAEKSLRIKDLQWCIGQ